MRNSSYLCDYEHGTYSDTGAVLEVGVSDGKAFLAIGQITDGYTSRTFSVDAQVGVGVEELIGVLTVLWESDLRHQAERRRAR